MVLITRRQVIISVAGAGGLMLLGGDQWASGATQPKTARRFRLFDATLFERKPSLARFGLEPLRLVGPDIGGRRSDAEGPIDSAMVREFLSGLTTTEQSIALDFELLEANLPTPEMSRRVEALVRIARLFRREARDRIFGFYSELPASDYWRAIASPLSFGNRSWRDQNDRASVLEPLVDCLFPSVYTFYDDRDQWVDYAAAQVREARRLSDKPVYPFIWPEYHEGPNMPRGRMVDADYWRLQLETLHEIADGLVIWGGWDLRRNRPKVWNPEARWWRQVRQFVTERAPSSA